jgi:hypothetical protein
MKQINLLVIALFATNVYANDGCILQEKTTTRSTATVTERSQIRSAVVPFSNGQKKCIVNYRAKVDNNWYEAMGEYVWDGSNSSAEACSAAVKQADTDLIHRIKPTGLISEQVLICNDNPDTKQLQESNVGTIVDISQLRTHPEHPGSFMDKGTECRWFIDPAFNGRTVHNFQGIACKISEGRWAVVDKF